MALAMLALNLPRSGLVQQYLDGPQKLQLDVLLLHKLPMAYFL
jgi:hypothetical protein